MTHVGVHEAKTTLSQLLKRVAAGEDVVITNAGEPVARLVPFADAPRQRIGVYAGRFDVPDDVDETPADILRHVT
jgi:prevent-host-death family protein